MVWKWKIALLFAFILISGASALFWVSETHYPERWLKTQLENEGFKVESPVQLSDHSVLFPSRKGDLRLTCGF